MSKDDKRLRRQFDALGRAVPRSRPLLLRLQDNRYRYIRLPLAVLLIAGGFLAPLPIFGLWMLPLGLLFLALDVPALRPAISAGSIRARRWWLQVRRRLVVARDD